MTAITYVAKRSIEQTDFSVAGDDISVINADSSFNATVTDMSGILDNQWILVAGFLTNPDENNGWFQVAGDSITTKIIQDTSALVDEAAVDNITIQGYLRGLGGSYPLETASHILTQSDTPKIESQESLSGVQESLFIRNDEEWNIQTDFIDETEWQQWLEFFRSVSAREPFLIDVYGTQAVPDNPVNAFIVGRPTYANPYAKTMQATFRVRVL